MEPSNSNSTVKGGEDHYTENNEETAAAEFFNWMCG